MLKMFPVFSFLIKYTKFCWKLTNMYILWKSVRIYTKCCWHLHFHANVVIYDRNNDIFKNKFLSIATAIPYVVRLLFFSFMYFCFSLFSVFPFLCSTHFCFFPHWRVFVSFQYCFAFLNFFAFLSFLFQILFFIFLHIWRGGGAILHFSMFVAIFLFF